MKPTNPSLPVHRGPGPFHTPRVSPARRLQVPAAPNFAYRKPAIERGLVIQDLRERIRQVGLGQNHRRAASGIASSIMPCVASVDEAILTQLVRRGQAVELVLTRVGPQQDSRRSIVELEELGECLDLVKASVPGKGAKSSPPDRKATSTLLMARLAAIASGAGRESSTTPSLPAATSLRETWPSLQTSTPIGLSPSATTLRSSFLIVPPARCMQARRRLAAGRASRRWSRASQR